MGIFQQQCIYYKKPPLIFKEAVTAKIVTIFQEFKAIAVIFK